ncbi:shikimate dehydrogenase [uncultured Legionella sp.]|uniref:shikimate dehydrogenase n=1 Tax=uncultured Legionella sp. TaxID=210934 RepID=UPI0026278D55|nr:shikimate dehydrogenase [uncultured Legionella sp.]
MVYHFAVIGNPIEHSLSPQIHQQFARQCNVSLSYEKIEGRNADFENQTLDFFQHGGWGLNVTLPFKQRAFAMAEVVSERCLRAGAANTLMIKNNTLYADNTDGIGLIRDLSRVITLQNKNILILGAGGATRGIIYPLLDMKPASLTLVNRTMAKAAQLQTEFPLIKITSFDELHDSFDLIINATSASLEGNAVVVPEAIMAHQPFCYDLAYSRKELTPFVCYAKTMGCKAADGLGMLVEQAAEAFYLWHGLMPQTEAVLQRLLNN